ncbi:response regulator transcription factor [Cytobacillus sp. FSL W7-1323]|uniref:DNA-binding response regulator n=1 Tax=Cytobacillus kochii TaxID=859143 RepID=A0A248TDW3_9BACI|nr:MULTISPECIES: response regulator transcription factor [Cytobacillus]ASV66377.1 DNA-binding response regulator [Cytobacillus kochii]MDQ0187425.1 DNA-binding NarL/FixJ family response regulator [Cytobacillus kochii]MEA1851500.1 response regulator transcription factor [Cytobacillus sp. OWB-43]
MNVLIIDDHHVVRKGLIFFLKTQKDIHIVGEGSTGEEAIKLTEQCMPDLILMDLDMPDMNGIEATKAIRKKFPQVKILILTSYSDQSHCIPAIAAGASGYQLKDVEPDELVKTMNEIMDGENYIHPKATTHLMSKFSHENEDIHLWHELTKREKEVLSEMGKGKSNKEIATDLFITEKTVKTHVSHILSKLDVDDRTQAAIFAVKNNFVK